MAWRHKGPALSRMEIDGAAPVEQRYKLGAGAASTTSRDHQYATRRPKQVDRLGDLRGIRPRHSTRLGAEMLVKLQRFRHDAAQRIGRKVDVGRARLATLAESPCYGL